MGSKILITSALPYANGDIHIGHLVEYIQTDIFVRFLKMLGEDVIYLCADDTHGTPILLKAKSLDIKPEELINKYNIEHQRDFKDFNIEFDYYHSTHSQENKKHSNYIFNKLLDNGHIITDFVEQYFCNQDRMFLSDRYIKGTCPNCKSENQYGDVCENCGLHYEPTELIEPYCAVCGSRPVIRESKHYFFKLSEFQKELVSWTSEKNTLQPETLNSIKGWLEKGLKNWDISRDAPYFGFKIPTEENKYFYVWLDAPVGYIATTEKYCVENNKDFNSYWFNPSSQIYHFIGKDIVYFHTLFWPAMLIGSGYNTPTSVFVHGFLTVNGEKMSKSKGTFITAKKYLENLDPQYLRYYYASKLSPNSDDIDLSLDDFRFKVNAELVNNIVNLGSRAVNMLNKNFNGIVSELSDVEKAKMDDLKKVLDEVKVYYTNREFSKGIKKIVETADEINKYFAAQQPWSYLNSSPEKAQQVCSFALNGFKFVCAILYPVLPKMVAEVYSILNLEKPYWSSADEILQTGHKINQFFPLLHRIEEERMNGLIS